MSSKDSHLVCLCCQLPCQPERLLHYVTPTASAFVTLVSSAAVPDTDPNPCGKIKLPHWLKHWRLSFLSSSGLHWHLSCVNLWHHTPSFLLTWTRDLRSMWWQFTLPTNHLQSCLSLLDAARTTDDDNTKYLQRIEMSDHIGSFDMH